MGSSTKTAISRRTALIGGGGLAAAALGTMVAPRLAHAAPAVQSGGGIAGGGTITVDKAKKVKANFSLSATRLVTGDDSGPIILGGVAWLDSTGFGFDGFVTDYGVIEGDTATARRIVGTAELMDGATQPFTMRVEDLGAPGDKKDKLTLAIGPEDNVIYRVDGRLSTGDLHLSKFDFTVPAATPVASPVAESE